MQLLAMASGPCTCAAMIDSSPQPSITSRVGGPLPMFQVLQSVQMYIVDVSAALCFPARTSPHEGTRNFPSYSATWSKRELLTD